MNAPGSIDDLGALLDEAEQSLKRARHLAMRKSYVTSRQVVGRARDKLLAAIDELHHLGGTADAVNS